jgi:hypothetical protein
MNKIKNLNLIGIMFNNTFANLELFCKWLFYIKISVIKGKEEKGPGSN